MKRLLFVISMVTLTASVLSAQTVRRENVQGIQNLLRLETTVACAGAITPDSVGEIKKMGFVSVINLRDAGERNANVEAEGAAARAIGLKYVHIPFITASPSTAAVDAFVKAIGEPGTEPAFIHCGGGNRAAAMWYVKRALIDKWDDARAMAEAEQLGFTSAALKTFMRNYVQTHKR